MSVTFCIPDWSCHFPLEARARAAAWWIWIQMDWIFYFDQVSFWTLKLRTCTYFPSYNSMMERQTICSHNYQILTNLFRFSLLQSNYCYKKVWQRECGTTLHRSTQLKQHCLFSAIPVIIIWVIQGYHVRQVGIYNLWSCLA